MFRIKSIRVFPETDERIRKNLQTDNAFVFDSSLEEDFFGKNIAVYAIVGKNGSGKSTLFEIIFRLVNNLAYVMSYDFVAIMGGLFNYVFDLYAQIIYEKDGIEGSLTCRNEEFFFTFGSKSIKENTLRIMYEDGDYVKSLAEQNNVKDIINQFFYTIAVSYSPYSYVPQDFLGEVTKKPTTHFTSP